MDRDERVRGAVAASMDRAGQHPFARAAFAAQQDRGLGGGGREGHIQRLLHFRFRRLQIDFRHHRAHLFFELLDLRFEPPHPGDPVEHHAKLIGREGLRQVIERPAAHRLDGGFDRGIRSDDHHVQSRAARSNWGKSSRPCSCASFRSSSATSNERRSKQRRASALSLASSALWPSTSNEMPQSASQAVVVVDDQDVHVVMLPPKDCLRIRWAVCLLNRDSCELRDRSCMLHVENRPRWEPQIVISHGNRQL